MAIATLFFVSAIFFVSFEEIYGRGMMTDPMSRSSIGRLERFQHVPINEDEALINCGGIYTEPDKIDGKCGPCGDDIREKVPRANENGGTYGKGNVARTFEEGKMTNVTVNLIAIKKGYFEFSICVLRHPNDIETEECFKEYPVDLIDEEGRLSKTFNVGWLVNQINVTVILPKELDSEHCVLRWQYVTATKWGDCEETGNRRSGCGPQEIFRNCADIVIDPPEVSESGLGAQPFGAFSMEPVTELEPEITSSPDEHDDLLF